MFETPFQTLPPRNRQQIATIFVATTPNTQANIGDIKINQSSHVGATTRLSAGRYKIFERASRFLPLPLSLLGLIDFVTDDIDRRCPVVPP
jgi:hypothetical protein